MSSQIIRVYSRIAHKPLNLGLVAEVLVRAGAGYNEVILLTN